MPRHCSRKFLDPARTSMGKTPSFTTRCSLYRSLMNRLSAVSRCLSPASMRSHSRRAIMRGMMSKGQARSMLPASL